MSHLDSTPYVFIPQTYNERWRSEGVVTIYLSPATTFWQRVRGALSVMTAILLNRPIDLYGFKPLFADKKD